MVVILTLPVGLCGGAASTTPAATSHPLVFASGRPSVRDALRPSNVFSFEPSDSAADASLAVDGNGDTAWSGAGASTRWSWTARFVEPAHLALLRARLGTSTTSGIPVAYEWESLDPSTDGTCTTAVPAETWRPIEGAGQATEAADTEAAQPTRRSWFVDVDACGLRLVVVATNGGPPSVREVQALEGARDVLRGGRASADGTLAGFAAAGAIDGSYAERWVGAPGRSRWTLRVDLPSSEVLDRVRLVLGLDATSIPRQGAGRSYAIAWGPLHYSLETSADGERFERIASEPVRPDGSVLPLRRRLVTITAPRKVRALRLQIDGATNASGVPDPSAVPVVRELSAYGADDPNPILAEPWFLSVDANPCGQTHLRPGGEMADDVRYARYIERRFASVLPALRSDDLESRWRTGEPEAVDAPSSAPAGEALESIEGDDPQLDALFLASSAPPPIAVLSGSNDWDYAAEAGPDAAAPRRWHWDPLRDARGGGMGGLASAVRGRVAPFLGFCGGAQILGLLEADAGEADRAGSDEDRIDAVLRRTTGAPIRGFASPPAAERAWPADPHPGRASVSFLPDDPLFSDVAGPLGRSCTRALPLCHTDAVRPDAFLPGGPLDRFELLATSTFCGPQVLAASPQERLLPNPDGEGWCRVIPQAFRSRDSAWPIVATQFHPEQRDFAAAAPEDPRESVDDPRLFLAAAYELVVDAHLRFAP